METNEIIILGIILYILGVACNLKILPNKKEDFLWVFLSWFTPIIIVIALYYDEFVSRKKGKGFKI